MSRKEILQGCSSSKVSDFYVTPLLHKIREGPGACSAGERAEKKESIPSPPPAPDESPRMISELVAFFYFV